MLLDGVRVISLCHYLQGPAASQYLADLGADVIKIEPIGGAYERKWSGADVFVGEISGFYLCANRNKRSVAINLKLESGRAALLRLVASADVVMENFRPGTMDRLGLTEQVLKSAKPDLIYGSATGFGADGPYAGLPGQDLLIQARTGLVSATAGQQPDILPAAAGCAVVDQHGGALFAMGILAALYRKERKGVGTRVESSLFNAGIDLQQEAVVNYINGGLSPEQLARDKHLATWFHEAPYGIYRLRDGRHLALSLNPIAEIDAALSQAFLAAGVEGYAPIVPSDVDGAVLGERRNRIAEAVAARLVELTYLQAEAALSARNLWFAPVNTYSDLQHDEQARHNRVFVEVDVAGRKATLVNHPNRYDGAEPKVTHIAERPGQDTRQILGTAGYSPDEIDELVSSGAVA